MSMVESDRGISHITVTHVITTSFRTKTVHQSTTLCCVAPSSHLVWLLATVKIKYSTKIHRVFPKTTYWQLVVYSSTLSPKSTVSSELSKLEVATVMGKVKADF